MPYATDTKAKAIVYGALHTDQQAAKKFGCSRTSIYQWRKQLDDDEQLQEACTRRWKEIRTADSWIQDATHTIRKAQGFIRNAADDLNPSDPEAVEAMTEALQTLTESLQMARIVHARLGTSPTNGEPGRQNGTRLRETEGGS